MAKPRPAKPELDDETYAYVRAFKPVAERVVEGGLTDAEYLKLVVSVGIERIVEDVINPREDSVLWATIVNLLRRDPKDFAKFMLEHIEDGEAEVAEEKKGSTERWQHYIR